MSVGLPEIIVVLFIALLVFGPKRLPEMGRQLGRTIREFRKAVETARTELGLDEVFDQVNDVKSDISSSMGLDEINQSVADMKSSVSGVTSDLGIDGVTSAISDVKSGLSLKGLGKAALGGGAAAAAGNGSGDGDPQPVTPAAAAQDASVGVAAEATDPADSDPASWPACD